LNKVAVSYENTHTSKTQASYSKGSSSKIRTKTILYNNED